MYRVSVRKHFDAAHYLRNYRGKCENMHGHRFEVVVTLEAQTLDEAGMAFDFTKLKKHLKVILDKYDHICLNEIPPFDEVNPSSENIAATICRELTPNIDKEIVTIYSVEVWESPDSWAEYLP